jgi:hypothetical protein
MSLRLPCCLCARGLAFWVEPAWGPTSSATLQAFKEGCYNGTWVLDSAGVRWPILEAALVRAPSLLEWLLPWRHVPVRLRLGQTTNEGLTVAVEEIRRVLHSPGFDYEGELSLEEFEAELDTVQSPVALIDLARRADQRAA